eukprot:279426_1
MRYSSIFGTINVLITTISAATISPTSISPDTKTEYYINSQFTGNTGSLGYFYNDIINCATETCHIICDASKGCDRTEINTDPTTTWLIIECVTDESCADMLIYANSVSNIDIQCNYNASTSYSTGACTDLVLYAQNAGTTSIYCSDNNCRWMKLHLNDTTSASITAQGFQAFTWGLIYADRIQNDLNIICNGTSERYKAEGSTNACGQTEIYTHEMASDVSLICYDNEACDGVRFEGGTMTGDVTVTCDGQNGDNSCYYMWVYMQNIAG